MKTTTITLDKLKPNSGQIEGLPANPRFIKDAQFERLKKSLEEDPEMMNLREVLVFPHGDNFVVIGGNMRYRAAMELGWLDVPCKVIPADTPVEKLCAFTIKDNAAFGEWDFDMLANEWDTADLSDWGVEGFPDDLNPDELGTDFSLKDGDKEPFEQMTFTLHTTQAEAVKRALETVDTTGMVTENENKNGNALYKIILEWAAQRKS